MNVGDKITFCGKTYEIFDVAPRYILAQRGSVVIRLDDPKEEKLQPIIRSARNYRRSGPPDTSIRRFGPFRDKVRMKAKPRFRIEWKRATYAWQLLLQDELAYYGYRKVETRPDGTEIWELERPKEEKAVLFLNEALEM